MLFLCATWRRHLSIFFFPFLSFAAKLALSIACFFFPSFPSPRSFLLSPSPSSLHPALSPPSTSLQTLIPFFSSLLISFLRSRCRRGELSWPRQRRLGSGLEVRFCGVRKMPWGRFAVKKTRIWLGTFDSAEEPARAYNAATISLRGCKAKTTFPAPPHALHSRWPRSLPPPPPPSPPPPPFPTPLALGKSRKKNRRHLFIFSFAAFLSIGSCGIRPCF